jgi:hypothetical protein
MTPNTPTPDRAQRLFYTVLILTTLLKLWLAVAIPLTGDEALFYKWGQHLDWGYYDHPPMGGWLLWLMQSISPALIVLRLPAVLLWIAVTAGMMDLFSRMQTEKSDLVWWLGSLFLLLPFTWALTLVTTDTPLIFFLFFSAYAFLRAEMQGGYGWFALSGALLGLALLSKYFAALLAIAYAFYFIFIVRTRRGWLNLIIIALCALPFFLLNIAYNSTHCWNNILFNVINRNQGSAFTLSKVAIYLGMMVYLITPWLLLRLLRKSGLQQWRAHMPLVILFVLPFTLFLLLSFFKTVGLHWVLAFLPFLFMFAALTLDADVLKKYCTWTIWLGIPHLIALVLLATMPTSTWQSFKLHAAILMHKETPRLISVLKQDMPADGQLMTRSYSSAALFGYYEKNDVPVFGYGSFHARMDDELTDYSKFNGKTIRIFDTRPITEESIAPYFAQVTVTIVRVDGARFWLAEGREFNFDAYRKDVLTTIATSFYRIPAFLPVYGCKFLERYDFWPIKK